MCEYCMQHCKFLFAKTGIGLARFVKNPFGLKPELVRERVSVMLKDVLVHRMSPLPLFCFVMVRGLSESVE